jgi:hypothetical protein
MMQILSWGVGKAGARKYKRWSFRWPVHRAVSAEFPRWRHISTFARATFWANGRTQRPKTYQVPIPETNSALADL